MLKKFPLHLSLRASYVFLTAASLAITVFLFIIQPDTNTPGMQLILDSNGFIFLLNWLPVLLTVMLVFFLTARVAAAAGLAAALFILPSVVNRYMIAMRHEPLQPLHLLLGAEFAGIAKSIRPIVFVSAGAGIIAFIILAALAFKLVKNGKPGRNVRISGAALCLGLAALLYFTVYSWQNVYDALPIHGNRYSETDQFQSKGFAYSFIHAVSASKLSKPSYYEEYRPSIERASSARVGAAVNVRSLPNIVIVQSEAFSELPLSPAISYEGYADPLENYKRIKEESLSGYAVAPHLGGGTSDMEFDVLTGLNTRDFRGVPYAFNLITRPFPSIASVLRARGYSSVAMHPGAAWFYNRQNVYPLMGFEEFLADESYDAMDTKGLYITERQTVDKLIEEFEARTPPRFMFCITIQNHGPYYGKYPGIKELNYATDLEISEEDALSLANYIEGVKDCDEGVKRLTDYFSRTDEPVLMLYYGDHLPSFPPALLNALAPAPENAADAEDAVHFYKTPFLIWTNEAAKPLADTGLFEASLPADRTISSHYLGAALLEMAGLTGQTGEPFMNHVNGMRWEYPVVLESAYRADEEGTKLKMYRSWEYYRITG